MAGTIDELRADLERSSRAIDRLTRKIDELVTERVDMHSKLDHANDANRLLLERHGALGKLHEELKSERNDLARQFGEEVAARHAAEAARKHADGLFVQANADRDRLKHELEQEKLTVGALKLLLDRAADALEAAANLLPEDPSAREAVAELRKAAKT